MTLTLIMTVFSLGLSNSPIMPPRQEGKCVVFVGDSNTYAGDFIVFIDYYHRVCKGNHELRLVNLGLPSETASGLSEAAHPFPRPCIHERLGRILAKVKPDCLVASYGMNDGIYAPPNAAWLKAYQNGINKLISDARSANARVTILTPPPFDPRSIVNQLASSNAPDFSWMKPYAKYDEVLDQQARWLLTLQTKDITVVDVHTALHSFMKEEAKAGRQVILARDGIHFDHQGHALTAAALLRAWYPKENTAKASVDLRTGGVSSPEATGLVIAGESVSFSWKVPPSMPVDTQWTPGFTKGLGFPWDGPQLVVLGLKQDRQTIWEGETQIGEITRAELEKGVSLCRFPKLSIHAQNRMLLALLRKQHGSYDRLLLEEIGHKRPGMSKPMLSMEEAESLVRSTSQEIKREPPSQMIRLTLKPAPSN